MKTEDPAFFDKLASGQNPEYLYALSVFVPLESVSNT